MAALQDSGSKDPAAKRAGMEGGGESKQKRARSIGVDTRHRQRRRILCSCNSAAASLVDVTVEEADALDCVMCYLPQKRPIFQGTSDWRRVEAARDVERARKGGPLMAALLDLGSKYPAAAKRAGRGGGGEPRLKRVRSVGVDTGGCGGGGSSAPAIVPASESRAHPESATASLDVTVEDTDALDCVVCFLPLKPPIFQCDVGHVVCSLCCDKLQATGKCHMCGVATSSYRRCHAMERLVESIRAPCLYAAYGCALRPAYYDQESHSLVCDHAPCHCPGEACSFVGSMAALLDHCSATHKWPCITTVKLDGEDEFTIGLHDGFNFLLADCPTSNKNQGGGNRMSMAASIQCLLLLTVERQPYVRIISVHCIDPHAAMGTGSHGPTSKEMHCVLNYNACKYSRRLSSNNQLINYWQDQESRFRVVRTDLSDGLPKPDDCYQFVVPNSVIQGHDKGIKVKVRIIIE